MELFKYYLFLFVSGNDCDFSLSYPILCVGKRKLSIQPKNLKLSFHWKYVFQGPQNLRMSFFSKWSVHVSTEHLSEKLSWRISKSETLVCLVLWVTERFWFKSANWKHHFTVIFQCFEIFSNTFCKIAVTTKF